MRKFARRFGWIFVVITIGMPIIIFIDNMNIILKMSLVGIQSASLILQIIYYKEIFGPKFKTP